MMVIFGLIYLERTNLLVTVIYLLFLYVKFIGLYQLSLETTIYALSSCEYRCLGFCFEAILYEELLKNTMEILGNTCGILCTFGVNNLV